MSQLARQVESLVVTEYGSADDLRQALAAGGADVGLALPAGFAERIAQGETVQLAAYIWGQSLLKNRAIVRQVRQTFNSVRSGRIEAALNETSQKPDGINTVLHAALFAASFQREHGKLAMETAVQEALGRSSQNFPSWIGLVSLAAGVAPLLGFLGTVAGLIDSFKQVAVLGAGSSALSGGIAEALIAMEAGLVVAVPCLLASGLLKVLADKAVLRLESGALSLMVQLLQVEEEASLELGGRT
jgi:biopolymer transport protein ExbB